MWCGKVRIIIKRGQVINYNKKYYSRNKKRLSKIKKDRYRKDTTYRDSIRKRSRVDYALESMEKGVRVVFVTHAGTKEKIFTLPQMAKVIKRAIQVVYRWKYSKVIPNAIYKTQNRQDRYAYSQVMFLASLIHLTDNDSLNISYGELSKILKEVWKKKFTTESLKEVLKNVADKRKKKSKKKVYEKIRKPYRIKNGRG